jgi:Zn-dependent protease
VSLAHFVLTRAMALVPLLLSLSVHEWAHAWAALQLGDTTARDQGRLTLNPLAHVDVVGTLALPLLGIPFGWAKPVPVEPTRFRAGVSMSWGMLLTAAAGPASNILLAAVCASLLLLGDPSASAPPVEALRALLVRGLFLNVALAVFNLLPIPPLDGSRVVDAFVPFEHRATWRKIGAAAGIALLLLLAIPLMVLSESFAGWFALHRWGAGS